MNKSKNVVNIAANSHSERSHVSARNRNAALTNIKRKLTLLQGWLLNGLPTLKTEDGHTLVDDHGRPKLDFIPRSLRQFNFWTNQKNQLKLPNFGSNSPATLRANPDLCSQVESTLAKLRLQIYNLNNSKNSRLQSKLNDQLKLEENRRKALEEELVRIRRDSLKSQEKVRSMSNQLSAAEKEYHSTLNERDAEISKLRKDNANLTMQLSKVVSLRNMKA